MKKFALFFVAIVLSNTCFAGSDITLSGVINTVVIAPQMKITDNEFKTNIKEESDLRLYKTEEIIKGELIISYVMF